MKPIPTINVNMKRSDCDGPHDLIVRGSSVHTTDCSSNPVLIPLSLEPFRSVTFEVALGECSESCRQYMPNGQHTESCPGRPIRVSCSISGGTWAESEVVDISPIKTDGRGIYEVGWERGQVEPVTHAVHERWALVKALVLGVDAMQLPSEKLTGGVYDLFRQRDAVFNALADMARTENLLAAKWLAIPIEYRRGPGPTRVSDDVLARYVERLVKQVGVLS